jgi:hypothetical protein
MLRDHRKWNSPSKQKENSETVRVMQDTYREEFWFKLNSLYVYVHHVKQRIAPESTNNPLEIIIPRLASTERVPPDFDWLDPAPGVPVVAPVPVVVVYNVVGRGAMLGTAVVVGELPVTVPAMSE